MVDGEVEVAPLDRAARVDLDVAIVGQLQRRNLPYVEPFCSRLMQVPFHADVVRRAVEVCIHTATAFVNGEVLSFMYPVALL